MAKLPVSVLVVVHTPQLEILLLERAARPGFWQSVTGSLDYAGEPLEAAALREVEEETGIASGEGRLTRCNAVNTFEIFQQWRHRFGPGVTHNTEHVFTLEVPGRRGVRLAAREHTAAEWLPWQDAARRCFSWSNRDAICMLAEGAVLS